MRQWFWSRGFIELDPPILVPWPSMEPHLIPLETVTHDGFGNEMRAFHHTSPEYALKKLLAAGMPDCFFLGHVFRDGEVSTLHEPEFTLVEWYRRDADYTALMVDTEELCADLAVAVTGSSVLEKNGHRVDLTPPWARITVGDAMRRWANVDIEPMMGDADAFRAYAVDRGHEWMRGETTTSWDELFFKLFLTAVEPRLGFEKPMILYDYPARFGALARRNPDRPDVVERFEAYIAGVELCNAFTELTDSDEQRRRFQAEQRERAALGVEVFPIDEDLLCALGSLPLCAGNALGVDRLVLLLTGETELARVVPFPWSVLRQWNTESD